MFVPIKDQLVGMVKANQDEDPEPKGHSGDEKDPHNSDIGSSKEYWTLAERLIQSSSVQENERFVKL